MTQEATELAPLPTVLIVDDSRIVRATVRKHLSEHYNVLEEADGEAGWRRLQTEYNVQLLVSDLTMPELDGMGLLARIRGSGDGRLMQLPIIIISGEEDEETKRRCVECGANDFITKSTDRSEMLARVAANIRHAQTQKELETARTQQAETATTDHTGAGTHHLLMLQTEQSLAFAHRHHSEVTLLLIEIDHFGHLQDKLGTRLAEQMLGLMAKHLGAKLRREDTLAHVEGPQFAVVSPGTTLNEARILGERLRLAIAGARVHFRDELVQVTASIAAANSIHDQQTSAAGLFAAATERLYAAAGNNRLLIPDQPERRSSPLLAEAMVMLHKGLDDDVKPHLPALMKNLLPLLELANREMGLGWPLDKLQQPS
ncbi:diguanylate cyclase (GGDEF) domain-containing protein [Andreprevotia lacus DSM 23236]|jgi:diguanylate cyclase (GGDEF)-like protein|uniref:Diguanylate cyclase (GGDEF) domain-containing protein n=1 Tax=Andreprevotia lacus DSM 23236 TaxID=1121001 RepID=A0A1W1WWQ8_9NEIS|nr:response regulator [Andreprevotia lacus]SMC16176.1 diguanylate cyclase (GGDEF) domain-containing protein [Andreprevotia lacus DSM 23236]